MDSQRTITSVGTHRFQAKNGRLDSLWNGSFAKVETASRIKTRLKDVNEGLTTTNELLKVLNYTWELDDRSSTTKSLIAALKCEIDRTRAEVLKLIQAQEVEESKIDRLKNKFAEERSMWKMKERERIHNAVKSIARELQVEKKLKGQTERLNKKLGKELALTRASLLKLELKVDNAKSSESTKFSKQVQKDNKMVKVYAKHSEAKSTRVKENNIAVVDKLRSELETCLRDRIAEQVEDIDSTNYDRINELIIESCGKGDDTEIDDSLDSDLQSIEFNMENNCRTYEWSYGCSALPKDQDYDEDRCKLIKDLRGHIVNGS